ncbi:tripartite tricarboxylate transporter substrate-binding protein [Cupriavidus basilensis]|uniref:Tripartite tricarboxylate transporter substrate-binding protein n=1 Tax=Cupriavidus basilensis TaxID=68895 RepID=A0ABT6ANL9_9BURK|nr:tripartite tricarboxylate transporter substrate-binding protein [Cupriavidus basilensis]MDF3834196.1 tripartite tricarboxylate transporter substrate-binding protein [Cupriavidus basilensis]
MKALPQVPTLCEQGLHDMDVSSWWGIVGPAGMAAPVVAKLNADITAVLNEPEVRAMLARAGTEPSPGTPEAFGRHIASEYQRWRQVVVQRNLRFD